MNDRGEGVGCWWRQCENSNGEPVEEKRKQKRGLESTTSLQTYREEGENNGFI